MADLISRPGDSAGVRDLDTCSAGWAAPVSAENAVGLSGRCAADRVPGLGAAVSGEVLMSESLAGVLFVTSLAVALVVWYTGRWVTCVFWVATSPAGLWRRSGLHTVLSGRIRSTEAVLGRVRRSVCGVLGGVNPVPLRFSSAAEPSSAQPRFSGVATGPGVEHRGELCDEYELAVVLR